MSYIGKEPQFTQYPSKFFNGDGTAMTVTLDYAPPNAAALLVFIDGVRQDTSAYTLSGTSLTFTGAVPSGTNNVQVVHLGLTQDVGVPSDDTISTVKIQDGAVSTVKIQDDAVTSAKLANSLNITSGNSLTIDSGATLSGAGAITVPSGGSLTIDSGATITNNGTNGGGFGKVLQVVQTAKTNTASTTSTSLTNISGFSVSITPSSASNKVLITVSANGGASAASVSALRLTRDGTTIAAGDSAGSRPVVLTGWYPGSSSVAQFTTSTQLFLDSPNTTSSTTYQVQWKTENGTLYLNRNSRDTNNTVDVRSISTITAMEIEG